MNHWDFVDHDDERERFEYQKKMNRGGKHFPCPTCGRENALSAQEKAKGYQCNRCADAEEGIF